VQGLDDVAALTHPAEDGLQVLGQTPPSRGDFFCQTESLQLLQASGAKSLTEVVLVPSGSDDAVDPRFPQEIPIQACEALLLDFGAEAGLDFVVGARAKIKSYDLGSSLPHASTQILPSDDEVFSLVLFTSEDDVSVRMSGIVMVNGDPIEFGPEIPLHLEHEATGQRLQIRVFDRVFCGDDETELMPVTVAAVEEGFSIAAVPL
jgi:hypothetical protein